MSNHGASPPGPSIVEMRGITIRFPGVLALDDVDFRLAAGEVHALMGENGAGKSTLIKALTGVYSVDSGDDRRGRPPSRVPHDRRRPGRRHLDGVPGGQPLPEPVRRRERDARPRAAPAAAASTGRARTAQAARAPARASALQIDTHSLLSSHSIAIQQLVAISRAMVLDARVLILDEPTSSLDRGEVEQLFAVIRDLRDRRRAPSCS